VKPWTYGMIVVIGFMFVFAIVARYHESGELPPEQPMEAEVEPTSDGTWTTWLRNRWLKVLPPNRLLPSTQPAYVRTWIYSFGALMLAALFWIVVTGIILTFKGQDWYHLTPQGRFIRTTHAWGTQLFFLFMAVHFLGVWVASAWRGGRRFVWLTGMLAFLAAVGEAFTGFLVQGNADSQWIASQAKDGLNAVGVGSEFNALNYGQMLLLHIAPFAVVLLALVVGHVLMVRRRGVVPPVTSTKTEEVLVHE